MIRRTVAIAGWLLVFSTLSTAPAVAQDLDDGDFSIADIEVRLLYETSGTLSEDVSDNPEFYLWNTIIGEGSAAEPANDVLVTARIEGPGEHNLGSPLTMVVRDEIGRTIAQRSIAYLYARSSTARSLFLDDVGCAGALTFEARLGNSVRTEEVTFDCGE